MSADVAPPVDPVALANQVKARRLAEQVKARRQATSEPSVVQMDKWRPMTAANQPNLEPPDDYAAKIASLPSEMQADPEITKAVREGATVKGFESQAQYNPTDPLDPNVSPLLAQPSEKDIGWRGANGGGVDAFLARNFGKTNQPTGMQGRMRSTAETLYLPSRYAEARRYTAPGTPGATDRAAEAGINMLGNAAFTAGFPMVSAAGTLPGVHSVFETVGEATDKYVGTPLGDLTGSKAVRAGANIGAQLLAGHLVGKAAGRLVKAARTGYAASGEPTARIQAAAPPETGPTEYGMELPRNKNTARIRVREGAKPIAGYDEMTPDERTIAVAKARGEIPANADAYINEDGFLRIRGREQINPNRANMPIDEASRTPAWDPDTAYSQTPTKLDRAATSPKATLRALTPEAPPPAVPEAPVIVEPVRPSAAPPEPASAPEMPVESPPTTVPAWLRENAAQTAQLLGPEKLRAIEDMAIEGRTAKEIAQTLGLTAQQVGETRNHLGIPSREAPGLMGTGSGGESADFRAWKAKKLSERVTELPPRPSPASEQEVRSNASRLYDLLRRTPGPRTYQAYSDLLRSMGNNLEPRMFAEIDKHGLGAASMAGSAVNQFEMQRGIKVSPELVQRVIDSYEPAPGDVKYLGSLGGNLDPLKAAEGAGRLARRVVDRVRGQGDARIEARPGEAERPGMSVLYGADRNIDTLKRYGSPGEELSTKIRAVEHEQRGGLAEMDWRLREQQKGLTPAERAFLAENGRAFGEGRIEPPTPRLRALKDWWNGPGGEASRLAVNANEAGSWINDPRTGPRKIKVGTPNYFPQIPKAEWLDAVHAGDPAALALVDKMVGPGKEFSTRGEAVEALKHYRQLGLKPNNPGTESPRLRHLPDEVVEQDFFKGIRRYAERNIKSAAEHRQMRYLDPETGKPRNIRQDGGPQGDLGDALSRIGEERGVGDAEAAKAKALDLLGRNPLDWSSVAHMQRSAGGMVGMANALRFYTRVSSWVKNVTQLPTVYAFIGEKPIAEAALKMTKYAREREIAIRTGAAERAMHFPEQLGLMDPETTLRAKAGGAARTVTGAAMIPFGLVDQQIRILASAATEPFVRSLQKQLNGSPRLRAIAEQKIASLDLPAGFAEKIRSGSLTVEEMNVVRRELVDLTNVRASRSRRIPGAAAAGFDRQVQWQGKNFNIEQARAFKRIAIDQLVKAKNPMPMLRLVVGSGLIAGPLMVKMYSAIYPEKKPRDTIREGGGAGVFGDFVAAAIPDDQGKLHLRQYVESLTQDQFDGLLRELGTFADQTFEPPRGSDRVDVLQKTLLRIAPSVNEAVELTKRAQGK